MAMAAPWRRTTAASKAWVKEVVTSRIHSLLFFVAYGLVRRPGTTRLLVSPAFLLSMAEEPESAFDNILQVLRDLRVMELREQASIYAKIRRSVKKIMNMKISESRKASFAFIMLSLFFLTGNDKLYVSTRRILLPKLKLMKNKVLAKSLYLFFPMNFLARKKICQSEKILLPILKDIPLGNLFVVEYLMKASAAYNPIPTFALDFLKKRTNQVHYAPQQYSLYAICLTASLIQLGKLFEAHVSIKHVLDLIQKDKKGGDYNKIPLIFAMELMARCEYLSYPFAAKSEIEQCMALTLTHFGSGSYILARQKLLRLKIMANPVYNELRLNSAEIFKEAGKQKFPYFCLTDKAECAIVFIEIMSQVQKLVETKGYNFEKDNFNFYFKDFLRRGEFIFVSKKDVDDFKEFTQKSLKNNFQNSQNYTKAAMELSAFLLGKSLLLGDLAEGEGSPISNNILIRGLKVFLTGFKYPADPSLVDQMLSYLSFEFSEPYEANNPFQFASFVDMHLCKAHVLIIELKRGQTCQPVEFCKQVKKKFQMVKKILDKYPHAIPRSSHMYYHTLQMEFAELTDYISSKSLKRNFEETQETWIIEEGRRGWDRRSEWEMLIEEDNYFRRSYPLTPVRPPLEFKTISIHRQ